MNYPAWIFWFGVGQFAWSLIVGWYSWKTRREAATNGRITAIEAQLQQAIAGHTQRLVVIESELRHVPTHDDLNSMTGKIFEKIDDLRKDLSEVVGGLKAMQRQFTLINEHLLRERQ